MLELKITGKAASVKFAGNIAQMLTDITTMIHALKGNMDADMADMFDHMFTAGVVSGLMLGTDKKSMKKLIDECADVPDVGAAAEIEKQLRDLEDDSISMDKKLANAIELLNRLKGEQDESK